MPAMQVVFCVRWSFSIRPILDLEPAIPGGFVVRVLI